MQSVSSAAERLRTLREMLGVTQGSLSAAAGISQSLLSSIEKLRRDATRETLEAVAAATDTPMSFFAVAPSSVPADSLHFRKNKTAPVKLTAQVKAYFRESHRVVTTLLERVSYPVGYLPTADARSETVEQEQIEDLAAQARAALRIDAEGPVPHLTRSLERAGVAVFRMALPGVEENRIIGKGHFGISYWGGPGERPVVGFFSGSGDRDRFTLAHELGHVILHTYRAPGDDAEREAHRFAGALLLPQSRAEELITPQTSLNDFARIKATFGISIQASIMRACNLGLIDESRKSSLLIQLSQRGWRTAEPVEVGNEEPQLVWRALSAEWPTSPYRSATEPLAIQPQVLRSLAPMPPAPVEGNPPAVRRDNVFALSGRR